MWYLFGSGRGKAELTLTVVVSGVPWLNEAAEVVEMVPLVGTAAAWVPGVSKAVAKTRPVIFMVDDLVTFLQCEDARSDDLELLQEVRLIIRVAMRKLAHLYQRYCAQPTLMECLMEEADTTSAIRLSVAFVLLHGCICRQTFDRGCS